MKYVECPEIYEGKEDALFLAGGITNCINWQKELAELLKDEKIVLLNPRRNYWVAQDESLERKQISWEFNHFKKASAVSFWFSSETLCPITLYELGKQISSDKPIFVGIHPDYKRKKDVEIQTELVRPEIKIVYSIKDLAEQIKKWIKNKLIKMDYPVNNVILAAEKI